MDKEYSLYHVGVLGMRWGIRKGKPVVGPRAKFLQRKLSKTNLTNEKKTKYEEDLKKEQEIDKKLEDRLKNMSKGKAFVETMIMGSEGAGYYNRLRAQEISKGKAAAYTTMASLAGLTIGTLLVGLGSMLAN